MASIATAAAAVAIGVAVVGAAAGIAGAAIQAHAVGEAAELQQEASQEAIAEQRRQYEETKKLLAPYTATGLEAMGAQKSLLGLSGPEAAQEQLSNIQGGPVFQALTEQAQQGIESHAAYTGQLRSGATQQALMRFRPQILADLVQQRFSQLGQLTTLGQAAAAGQASAGQVMAGNVSQLQQGIGAAQAGAALGQGQAWAGGLQAVGQSVGQAAGVYSGLRGPGLSPTNQPAVGGQVPGALAGAKAGFS